MSTTSYDLSFAPAEVRGSDPAEPGAVPVTDEDLTAATVTFFGSGAYRRDTDHLFDAVQSARTEIMGIAQRVASARLGG